MTVEKKEIKTVEVAAERSITAPVPGSKSITNRALLLAAMAEGESLLHGCMASEDARVFLEALKEAGFRIVETPAADSGIVHNIDVRIEGCGGKLPKKSARLYVGSAGTAARFLLAMLAFSDGEYELDSSDQMKKRPMGPLIEALRSAGAEVECPEEEGHFPLRVKGNGGKMPEKISVDISQSSQFLSALLIAAAAVGKPLRIGVKGDHGLAYVDMSLRMMESFGVHIRKEDGAYVLDGREKLQACDYKVEPDMSAAAYFYAAAAILGCRACVKGVKLRMLQGDTQFLQILKQCGCSLTEEGEELYLQGPLDGKLKGGFTADLSACSDQALTLAAIAPFADERIVICGIGHIRLQECDRIAAIVQNLRAMGIDCEEKEDGVVIIPGEAQGAELETFGDHRVAMSFALSGLRIPGVVIRDPLCCRKTFAEYFEVLTSVFG